MFIPLQSKDYAVSETHITYGILEAITLEYFRITDASYSEYEYMDRQNYIRYLPDKDNLSKVADYPITGVSMNTVRYISRMFSKVYSSWCNKKIKIRPLKIEEFLYCCYGCFKGKSEADMDYMPFYKKEIPSHVIWMGSRNRFKYKNSKDLSVGTNFPYLFSVKQTKPNRFGLYDIIGSVYTMLESENDDECILIGGCHNSSDESYLLTNNRLIRSSNDRWSDAGFRLLLEEEVE